MVFLLLGGVVCNMQHDGHIEHQLHYCAFLAAYSCYYRYLHTYLSHVGRYIYTYTNYQLNMTNVVATRTMGNPTGSAALQQ